MQIAEFLAKKVNFFVDSCEKKLHFGKSFLWAPWRISNHACSVDVFSFLNMLQKSIFCHGIFKNVMHKFWQIFFSNFSHKYTIKISIIDFFYLILLFHLILRNYYIRPPRVFKILSTKFQWTQTIERDLVERSAYAMILGNNTKFLVNCLYVAGSNLNH